MQEVSLVQELTVYKYELRKIHDRHTGAVVGNELEACGHFCDFCGKEIDTEEVDWPGYEIKENGDLEASYLAFCGPSGIELSWIFDNHSEFLYCCGLDSDESCERSMIEQAATREQGPLTIGNIMQRARIAVVKKLLASGRYTDQELGLVEDLG